jgi:hypothetical protein
MLFRDSRKPSQSKDFVFSILFIPLEDARVLFNVHVVHSVIAPFDRHMPRVQKAIYYLKKIMKQESCVTSDIKDLLLALLPIKASFVSHLGNLEAQEDTIDPKLFGEFDSTSPEDRDQLLMNLFAGVMPGEKDLKKYQNMEDSMKRLEDIRTLTAMGYDEELRIRLSKFFKCVNRLQAGLE